MMFVTHRGDRCVSPPSFLSLLPRLKTDLRFVGFMIPWSPQPHGYGGG